MATIKRGAKGDAVKLLQQQLRALGYDPGAIDGVFGTRTDKAVKAFQSENGLDVDGIVGEFTWTRLEQSQTFTGEATQVG